MSVADEVEQYVERRPYIQEALSQEIVNYSALARKLGSELDGSFEAIKMALRRHAEDVKERRKRSERNIGKVLEGTAFEFRNNIKVCKTGKSCDAEIFAKTESGYTYIIDEGKGISGEIIEDQVLITLRSSGSLEETPGVLAYLLSLFGAREINITELISCREDTHIVIDEEDATEVFELLNRRIA